MYYIIKEIYVGPNQTSDRFRDFDNIKISITPQLTNSSHEVCTKGWCGTTNDIAVYAHGVFDTLSEAREAMAEKFGELRDFFDTNYECDPYLDDDVIEAYRLTTIMELMEEEEEEEG